MLQVTEAAAIFLKEVIHQSEAPDDAAVRLERRTDRPDALGFALVELPSEDDDVIEESGLRVFVACDVSETLSERKLDVVSTQQGVGLTLL